jgi:uncharacterized cupredoxin-like copper-binding protein
MKKLLVVLLIWGAVVMTACADESGGRAALSTAEFTVVATDNVYDKPELAVLAGQPVYLTFRNEGSLLHDFTIATLPLDGEAITTVAEHDDLGDHEHDMEGTAAEVDVHVAAAINGGSSVLQFTPTEPGTYEYYCTVEGHKEAGMVGQLVVAAP